MAVQQRLDLRMTQQLVMTPQLQLAIKLLQMTSQDLQGFLNQEILDNPFLTTDDDSASAADTPAPDAAAADPADRADDSLRDDDGWDNVYDTDRTEQRSSSAPADSDDRSTWENVATPELTLRDHLRAQLGLSTDDPVLTFLGHVLIDGIDDAGYLKVDPDALAGQMGVSAAKMHEALALVQGFDPTGVGARSLAECLRLQLDAGDNLTKEADVVLANLELLAKRDYAALARKANSTLDELKAICAIIVGLTPKPGLKYGSDVSSNVTPDLVVRKDADGVWQVELNAESLPKVLLNSGLSGAVPDKDRAFVTDKLSRAQWLLKSLEQRAKTIFKVGKAIVAFQSDFFDRGVESLQPMTLKIVADAIGVHESTVSRVTTGKFMQTPLGVFELKYFFSSAIATTGGKTSVASESVRQMIRRLLKTEDERKPFSDEDLVALLRQEGVEVARRTVAKYREELGIPSSSQRRKRG
jgi:RNA polymerase sigma-54 factor